MTFIKGEPAGDVLPTAVLHKYLNDELKIPAADVLPTTVLHKYLNDELKILCLLQFFTEVAQNSLRIP